MRKVLIVTCDFPPQSGTGITRVTKLLEHLPEVDWRPVVLTTDRYGGLPTDEEQLVYRAGDLLHTLFRPLRRRRIQGVPQDRQYLVATVANQSFLGRLRDRVLIPDTKLGWLPGAVRLGRALIDRYHPDVIFSTSPPETAHLVALRLHDVTRLPWVMDLRDGWLFEPPNAALRRPRTRRWLESRLERRAVHEASAMTTATAPIGEDLAQRYPEAAARVRTLANGYDPAEFAGLSRQRKSDGTFLLVHTGSLGASRSGTSADSLFAGLAALCARRPTANVRVRMIGVLREFEAGAARAHGVADIVEFLPPVSRREAHQHQLDADALLLVTAPGQRSVASLKLYDYIGAGVPILALAEGNAAAEIVHDYRLGPTVPPNEPDAIATALEQLLDGAWTPPPASGDAGPALGLAEAQRRFQWRNLAGQLAGVFDDAAAPR